MSVCQIDLLIQVMMPKLFIKLAANPRVVGLLIFLEWNFQLPDNVGHARWKLKIEASVFTNTLRRPKNEDFVLQNRSANLCSGIPPQKKSRILSGYIR